MAINTIDDYSTTAASNIDLQGFSIQGTAAVSNFDNALRELMVDIANSPLAATPVGTSDGINTQSSAIASATSIDLSTATGVLVPITGTNTIAAMGTETAGAIRVLKFGSALTITHNATSMILPRGANLNVGSNDVVTMRSLGSGNWICESYAAASLAPIWENIDTRVWSASTSAALQDLAPFITLRITGFLKPSTDAVILNLQTSDDNAATWSSGAGAYDNQATYSVGATVGGFGGADTKIDLSASAIGNAVGEGINFEIIANNFNTTNYTYFTINTDYVNSEGNRYTTRMMARRVSATAQNAIKLQFASGTLAGPVTFEGIRG